MPQAIALHTPTSVTAFVDWNAQITNSRADDLQPLEKARKTLERTAISIAASLTGIDPSSRFLVGLRLYHGWYKGWERTENFRAITTTVSETRFADLSHKPNVIFSPDVEYGHTLLSALPRRLNTRPPIHLPNTLRQQNKSLPPTEKMVDTALATDLLEWARSEPQDWAIVLAEDDDLVPPVFTAESWINPGYSRSSLKVG